MAKLSEEDREILTVWVCLEWAGNAPDGNDVWYFKGVFTDEASAREQCVNEYFAIGPAVQGEAPNGTWDGLYFPRRGGKLVS